jgi:hypothetical protein
MAEEPDVIRQQIDLTRSSLTEKLETLENEVRGTVEGAKATVENTIESAKATVDSTIKTVKSTMQNVKRNFDIRYQMDRHPWAMMGASLFAGYLAESYLGPRRASMPRMETASLASEAFQGNGHEQTSAAAELAAKPGLLDWIFREFEPEIRAAKEVAIGAAVGLARDVLKESLPQLAPHVDEIMNSVTSKLGGRPIEQPILRTETRNSRGGAEF